MEELTSKLEERLENLECKVMYELYSIDSECSDFNYFMSFYLEENKKLTEKISDLSKAMLCFGLSQLLMVISFVAVIASVVFC